MGRIEEESNHRGGNTPKKTQETKVCDPLDFYEQLKMPQKITYTKLTLKCDVRNTLWNQRCHS